MTYRELYEKAAHMLDKNVITLGQFEDMIKPLEDGPIIGRWKKRRHYITPLNEAFVYDYECSNCHFPYGEIDWNFCPICGARMHEADIWQEE